jgi:hypothetical protein
VVNDDTAPLRAIVKLLEPVLETVISPRGPEDGIPEVSLLLMAPEIAVGVAWMVNDEVAKELVCG